MEVTDNHQNLCLETYVMKLSGKEFPWMRWQKRYIEMFKPSATSGNNIGLLKYYDNNTKQKLKGTVSFDICNNKFMVSQSHTEHIFVLIIPDISGRKWQFKQARDEISVESILNTYKDCVKPPHQLEEKN